MQFFWGTLVADLQNCQALTALIACRQRASAMLSGLCVLIGLTFASFPEDHAEWMTWSRVLMNVMRAILPENPDYGRFGSGIGLEFLTLAILLSPNSLQRMLSSKYLLFLGKMSFAIYLLHGALLRTILVWMLYGIRTSHKNMDGELITRKLTFPGGWILLAWQIIWLPMVYMLASLWTAYVDPWFDRLTSTLVDQITLKVFV